MSEKDILKEFGFTGVQEIKRVLEEGLNFSIVDVLNVEKSDLTQKADIVATTSSGKQLIIQLKKFPEVRYNNLLPSLLESGLDSDKKDEDFVLVVKVQKPVTTSILEKVRNYLQIYNLDHRLSWVVLDSYGKLVGRVHGRDVKTQLVDDHNMISYKTDIKSTHQITFSPLQQWLLKVLLLNGINESIGSHHYWPLDYKDNLSDYKALARYAGTSPSTTFSFIRMLVQHRYLEIHAFGYSFRNLSALFEDWARTYLKEKKEEVYLTPVKPLMSLEKWQDSIVQKFGEWSNWNDSEIVMSGHLAAKAINLSYSNECSVIFHAPSPKSKDFREFLKDMKLRVSENSSDGISALFSSNKFPIREIRQFSQSEGYIADPIQIYLDVQYTGARGREQADYIFEWLMKEHFRRQQWQR